MTRREIYATAHADRIDVTEVFPTRKETITIPVEQVLATPMLIDTLRTVRAFLISKEVNISPDHWMLDIIDEALAETEVEP